MGWKYPENSAVQAQTALFSMATVVAYGGERVKMFVFYYYCCFVLCNQVSRVIFNVLKIIYSKFTVKLKKYVCRYGDIMVG